MVFEGGEDRLTPSERIEAVKAAGHDALTEAEAKRFLAAYGIPVVAELTANDAEEAAERADAIGFPVVLKGLGAKLTHKTERGLVRLNLKDKDDVLAAARFVREAAGPDLEGYLVQPMVAGRREFGYRQAAGRGVVRESERDVDRRGTPGKVGGIGPFEFVCVLPVHFVDQDKRPVVVECQRHIPLPANALVPDDGFAGPYARKAWLRRIPQDTASRQQGKR